MGKAFLKYLEVVPAYRRVTGEEGAYDAHIGWVIEGVHHEGNVAVLYRLPIAFGNEDFAKETLDAFNKTAVAEGVEVDLANWFEADRAHLKSWDEFEAELNAYAVEERANG